MPRRHCLSSQESELLTLAAQVQAKASKKSSTRGARNRRQSCWKRRTQLGEKAAPFSSCFFLGFLGAERSRDQLTFLIEPWRGANGNRGRCCKHTGGFGTSVLLGSLTYSLPFKRSADLTSLSDWQTIRSSVRDVNYRTEGSAVHWGSELARRKHRRTRPGLGWFH